MRAKYITTNIWCNSGSICMGKVNNVFNRLLGCRGCNQQVYQWNKRSCTVWVIAGLLDTQNLSNTVCGANINCVIGKSRLTTPYQEKIDGKITQCFSNEWLSHLWKFCKGLCSWICQLQGAEMYPALIRGSESFPVRKRYQTKSFKGQTWRDFIN